MLPVIYFMAVGAFVLKLPNYADDFMGNINVLQSIIESTYIISGCLITLSRHLKEHLHFLVLQNFL